MAERMNERMAEQLFGCSMSNPRHPWVERRYNARLARKPRSPTEAPYGEEAYQREFLEGVVGGNKRIPNPNWYSDSPTALEVKRARQRELFSARDWLGGGLQPIQQMGQPPPPPPQPPPPPGPQQQQQQQQQPGQQPQQNQTMPQQPPPPPQQQQNLHHQQQHSPQQTQPNQLQLQQPQPQPQQYHNHTHPAQAQHLPLSQPQSQSSPVPSPSQSPASVPSPVTPALHQSLPHLQDILPSPNHRDNASSSMDNRPSPFSPLSSPFSPSSSASPATSFSTILNPGPKTKRQVPSNPAFSLFSYKANAAEEAVINTSYLLENNSHHSKWIL